MDAFKGDGTTMKNDCNSMLKQLVDAINNSQLQLAVKTEQEALAEGN
jgi:phosphate uptake regulator